MAQHASSLSVDQVSINYGRFQAVDDVSFDVRGGEFLGLLGPSGCGKTTLLRMIAGFLSPTRGRLLCDGRDITDQATYQRRFGVVFQNYALFPHMTAAENVGYGLKVARVPKAEMAARVARALDRVGLSHAGERYPAQLSGGMQQRVALARALVIEPAILLLDEPLSALDKNLREDMQVELRMLQQTIGVTTIFVTHDQEEAMTLSDRIAVMQGGKLLQIGSPDDVYLRPTNRFVSTFLGTTNLIEGRIAAATGGQVKVDIAGQEMIATGDAPAGASATVAIRPENLSVSPAPGGLTGTIKDILFQGHRLIVLFETATGQELRAFTAATGFSLAKGDAAFASWDPAHARLLQD